MADTSARPTYGNWRQPPRPGIGSLGMLGTAVLLGGLIVALLAALASWIAALVIAAADAAVVIPLAIRTTDGRAAISVLAGRVGWAQRRAAGGAAYVSGPLSPRPGGQFRPPGLLAPVQMREGRDAYGRRFGVLHNPAVKTDTIVLACDPDGGALVDAEQIDVWVAQWGAWLASLAHEPGLLGASVVVETAPDPGTRLAAEVLSQLDPRAPARARDVMTEVVASYPAASSEISTYVTLTYGPGGGRRNTDAVTDLAVRLPGLASGLAAAGAGSVRPVAADGIAGAVRVAYDPAVAAAVLQARTTTGSTGLRWEGAGPGTAEETLDAYSHESAVSRSWVACEAPRGTVRSAVLRALLEPSPRIRRKRVAILYRPEDPASAARIVESDRRSAHFMAASTTGLVNARASAAVRAAEQAAAEEASGAGLIEFGLVVTATVDDADGLAAADAEIANLAATARMRLRVARGQQATAFATALPAGVLPWLHTLLPHQLRRVL
jgi:hypothetical protein